MWLETVVVLAPVTGEQQFSPASASASQRPLDSTAARWVV